MRTCSSLACQYEPWGSQSVDSAPSGKTCLAWQGFCGLCKLHNDLCDLHGHTSHPIPLYLAPPGTTCQGSLVQGSQAQQNHIVACLSFPQVTHVVQCRGTSMPFHPDCLLHNNTTKVFDTHTYSPSYSVQTKMPCLARYL